MCQILYLLQSRSSISFRSNALAATKCTPSLSL
ncbi:hypothetical protein IEO21_01781 [Rhodonia placenta]|uniref:Uncharacterized protein n=1 Tax=Rhodonia placenta TaxID=104341 RepID=A0A8H7P8V0_9APHY|nr:hypothetical protein IEO21_01781 [Postia placenta]